MNRAPTKCLNGKTPYEAWFSRKPGVKHLHVFGCRAFAKKLGPGISKLSDRSILGVFFGCESGTKGYRIFDPVNNRLMVSRDVIFDEQTAWNWEEKNDELGGMMAAVPYTFEVQYDDIDMVQQ